MVIRVLRFNGRLEARLKASARASLRATLVAAQTKREIATRYAHDATHVQRLRCFTTPADDRPAGDTTKAILAQRVAIEHVHGDELAGVPDEAQLYVVGPTAAPCADAERQVHCFQPLCGRLFCAQGSIFLSRTESLHARPPYALVDVWRQEFGTTRLAHARQHA